MAKIQIMKITCFDCKGTGTEMEYDRFGDGGSHCCWNCKGLGYIVKTKKPIAPKTQNS